MVSDDFIKINGVSSDTINVWVDTPPVPPMARQKYTTWQTAADESGVSPDDTWEDISLTFKFYTFFDANYNNTAIYNFFAKAQTLEFSRHAGFYYKVKQVSLGASEEYDGNRITYTASFKLSPFRYNTTNPEITVASGDLIENAGSRYARPVYELTSNGANAQLKVNGEAFNITALDGTAVIDAARMIVYDKSTGASIMPKCNGFIPFLQPGDNQIIFTGTSLTLRKNERWY